MTCKEFIDFLLDYFEGQLPDDQAESFRQHMQVCPDCVSYLNSYKETVALVNDLAADEKEVAELDVPQSLIEAVLAAQKK